MAGDDGNGGFDAASSSDPQPDSGASGTARSRLPLRVYFALLIGVFVVAAGTAALYVRVQGGRDARAEAARDARFAASTAADQLGEAVASLRATVRNLGANPQIAQVIRQPAGCTLTYAGSGEGDRGHVDILRADGVVVCSSRARTGGGLGSYAGAEWLRQAREGAVFLAPVRDGITGRHVAVSAVPVGRQGVIAGFFDLDAIGPHLAALYGGGRPVVFLVTTRDGKTVVTRSADPVRWIGTPLADTDFVRAPDRAERRDLEGRVRLYEQATVPGTGWRIHAGEDKAEVMAARGRLENRQLTIILVGLIGFLLAVALVYRRVAQPIARLGASVRSAGDDGAPQQVPVPPGAPVEVAGLAEDVNELISSVNRELLERQRAEAQVRRLAAIVETSDDAIVGQALDGTITSWNAGAERMCGYRPEEMVGRSVAVLLPSERQEALDQLLDLARTDGSVRRFETVWVRKDGARLDVALTMSPIEDRDGAVAGVSSIARDVSERKHAAQALQRSEESYRHLFELHPAPMWVFDPESLRFLAVNETAIATYGYSREEFLSMTIEEIRPVEDRALLRETLGDPDRGAVEAGIWRHLKKDGTVIDAAVSSNALEFEGRPARLVLAQDVTQQRRLEEQLRQAQKMEAVGNLAGGIAHDFNNVVMVIRTVSALLLKRSDDEWIRKEVGQIDTAAERAAELTHQLLAFSRQQILRPTVTDLNAVVAEIVGLLRRLIGEDIEVVAELDPEVRSIVVDRGQLGQVILNLAVNARDAMPTGGTLAIRTANAMLDEAYAAEHIGVAPGPHVVLQVSDSGVGMDETTRSRIFDPFFTTKESGTGLGLATVYGIVNQSGGHIWVYSEPGLGTTFKVYFPSTALPAGPEAAPAEVHTLEGRETILLVEDDKLLRPLMTEALRSYGYTVYDAGGGTEALALLEQHGDALDLLITDVVMPAMTGRELAERVLAQRPDLKVLFTSGYPADTVLRHGIADEGAAYIEKPYLPEDLARTIRELFAAG